MINRKAGFFSIISSVKVNLYLIKGLVVRDISSRYRGSAIGFLWSFITPVLMLAVYTFVFSTVFKARWPGGSASKAEFALILFAGLMVFNVIAECLSRSPGIIVGNANYVKKVVFPLEVLPVVILLSALFNLMTSLIVWTFFCVLFIGLPPATIFLLPAVVAPLILISLGCAWFLASLGTYLRDVGQVIGVFITMLMFLSPIFYPLDALPEQFRKIISISPVSYTVEQARMVMVWGKIPDLKWWLAWLAIGFIIAWSGFAWFQKTRKGFADVL